MNKRNNNLQNNDKFVMLMGLLTHFLKGLPDLLRRPGAQLPRHTDAFLGARTEENAVLSESRHVFGRWIVNEKS